jgi:hypothetical protein
VILDYWNNRGIRLGNKSGFVPEMDMTSIALCGRLERDHGVSLAQVVEELLGSHVKPLTVNHAKAAILTYLKKGVRLHRKFGHIPELGMSSYNLSDRLKRNFGVNLSALVTEMETNVRDRKKGA